MAEVAGAISNAEFWQMVCVKGVTAEGVSVPNDTFWACAEYAQDCHPQGWSAGLGCIDDVCPMSTDMGHFNVKRDYYEEDTVHHTAEG